MKIGVVSAHKHCKTHLRSLRREGYDIHCLGDDPKYIPSSYDVVIVRVASSSHQGVAVARDWSRDTGKPSLYENGLTGIRMALKALAEGDTPVAEPSAQDGILDHEKARCLMLQWGASLHEARPEESPSFLAKHLKATLRREHPDQYSFLVSLVPSVCAEIIGSPLPLEDEGPPSQPEPETPQPVVEEKEKPMSASDLPPYPPNASWARVYTPKKIDKAVQAARQLIKELGPREVDAFREVYLRCEKNPSQEIWKWASRHPKFLKAGAKRTVFCAKPVMYVAFVYSLFEGDTTPRSKRAFYRTYHSLTGKGADTRIPNAVAWFMGCPPPAESEAHAKAVDTRRKRKKVAPQPEPKPVKESPGEMMGVGAPTILPLPSADNTATIVGLLDDVAALRKEVASLREAAAAVPSSALGPFAAVEEIKTRLAAAGFKGTLTLTVE